LSVIYCVAVGGAASVGGVTIEWCCRESLECIGILLLRFGS
jgi:hypothetical protein